MAFFDIFKKKTVSSSNIAKGRLQLALASDRAGCSPEIMEKIKNDIINVISKYIESDSFEFIRFYHTPQISYGFVGLEVHGRIAAVEPGRKHCVCPVECLRLRILPESEIHLVD